jgi:SAM-dependent methyltransferase
MTDDPWYKTLFGEDYLRMYEPILTPERTQREVDGIVNLLALPLGSSILDLCCGHGRHSVALAQRGYQVTGQDLSEVFLHEAEKEAVAKGVHVDWVHSDMRHIPFENTFDAVINIFTAFGYLETQDEDQGVLKQVSKALRPNGLFLLETLQREKFIRHFEPHMIEHHPDGLIVLEERDFDMLTSRANVKLTMIYADGKRKEYGHAARIYTLTELAQMLSRAGLQVKGYYGAWDKSRLTIDSLRLLVLAQKVE